MPLFADRYELGPVIGYGGMAEVRAGQDTRLERPVAVKIMRREVAHQSLVRDRFESEARLAARLMHPNVVSVFDSGEQDGLPYIVMERLPGDTLHDRLARGPMAEADVRELGAEILAGLQTAHAAGILHRDIKPANVLATGNGHWKVTDFGIAKALEVDQGDATATGLVLGTPAYLAPERLYGAPATIASDLYSVGVVLYEALAGRRPFEAGPPGGAGAAGPAGVGAGGGGTAGGGMAGDGRAGGGTAGGWPAGGWPAVISGAPLAPLASIRPGVDPALAGAIERSLSREPSERFWSAADMAAAIDGRGAPVPEAAATTVLARGPATEVLPVGGVGQVADTAVYGTAAGAGGRVGGPPPGVRDGRPGRNPAARALAVLAGVAVLAAIIIAAVAATHSGHGGSPKTSVTTAVATTKATTAPTTAATTVAPSTAASTSTTSTSSTSTTSTTTTTTLLPVTVPAPGPTATGAGPGGKHHH